jgi:hypothetical protein
MIQTIPQIRIVQISAPAKAASIVNRAVNSFVSNNQVVNQLSQTTNISAPQVQNIINSFKQHIADKPIEAVNKISKETGIEREKVINVLKQFKEMVKQKEDLVKEILEKENVSIAEMNKMIDSLIALVTEPAKPIEEAITIPPTVSLDEYEQVKKMWVDHYERGELPVSENITNRKEWVERDIIFITNTLNKLLSDDSKLKQEGLDDVSYILPIFLINNLSGEQLIAYLKAKLEAAKQVQKLLEKEEEIKERLKAETEEKVEVSAKKKEEAAKEMEMGMEIEEKQETKAENNLENPVKEEKNN